MAFEQKKVKTGGRAKGTKNKQYDTLKSVYEDLIGSFKSGRFYVYYHICLNTKEVVYIGKGTNNRAWEFTDTARNENWVNYKKNNKLEVKIIASNLSQEESLAIEKVLIEIKKPILNITHNGISEGA